MKVRTEAKRDAILQVAAQVFFELGFEGASMAEIASRVGGSKATLYGYFASKEELFVAVCLAAGEQHSMASASDDVAAYQGGDVRPVLTRFGEKLVAFLFSDDVVAAHRMVIAVAGRSDIGSRFYEGGPKLGLALTADLLQRAMDVGQLRPDDPWIAAQYFFALMCAEHDTRWLCGESPPLTKAQIKRSVDRGVSIFLKGYGMSA